MITYQGRKRVIGLESLLESILRCAPNFTFYLIQCGPRFLETFETGHSMDRVTDTAKAQSLKVS